MVWKSMAMYYKNNLYYFNMIVLLGSDLVVSMVQVHGGLGYPVFERNGDQGHGWKLGEVSLNREYTGSNFNVSLNAVESILSSAVIFVVFI